MNPALSLDQIFAFRLSRSLIAMSERLAGPAEVASRLCGVQAQLAPAAAWALRVRMRDDQADIDAALRADRRLVKTWLMRGTVHLIASAELDLYIAAIGASAERQILRWLETLGLSASAAQGLADAIAALLEQAPLTRQALADAMEARTGPASRKLITHGWGGAIKLAAIQGLVCFGPTIGREVTFIARTSWLGDAGAAKPNPAQAISWLLRQYLACYGPATPRDFSHWSGIPMTLAHQAFGEARLAAVTLPSGLAWLLPEDAEAAASAQLPEEAVLLESFDPFALAHAQKDWLAEPADQKLIYRKAGWVSALALADGTARGTWTKTRGKRGTAITITPFGTLTATQRAALENAALSLIPDAKVAFG